MIKYKNTSDTVARDSVIHYGYKAVGVTVAAKIICGVAFAGVAIKSPDDDINGLHGVKLAERRLLHAIRKFTTRNKDGDLVPTRSRGVMLVPRQSYLRKDAVKLRVAEVIQEARRGVDTAGAPF